MCKHEYASCRNSEHRPSLMRSLRHWLDTLSCEELVNVNHALAHQRLAIKDRQVADADALRIAR